MKHSRSMTIEQRLHILSLREEWDDACQAYLAQEAADARYMEGLVKRRTVAARVIVAKTVFPPIPIRNCDWIAYYEDNGDELRNYGWGPTEQAAIEDLKANYGNPEDGAE